MSKAQVGTGKEVPFGKISDASIVPTDETGIRENFTRDRYTTPCGAPDFGPGLAGGNRSRFQELKSHTFGSDVGTQWDSDYEIVRSYKRRRREPDVSKGEDETRD